MNENILTKPYTNQEYAEFAIQANSNGQRVEVDENGAYALYEYEELQGENIVDISENAEYIAQKLEKENSARKLEIQADIDTLDKKRVRALAEGGVYDAQTGQTYLEYYTEQIIDLREELAGLE